MTALALLIVLPGTASAGTMRGYGTYDGDPGVNTVTASFNGSSVTLSDSAGITLTPEATYPGEGDCSFVSATTVSCAYPRFQLGLEAGNDSFTYVGAAPPGPADKLFFVEGGAGADVLNGSPYQDDLTGDGLSESGYPVADPAGNDQLFGNGGDDDFHDDDGSSNRIEGGAGVDRTYIQAASKAANVILGGPGDDFLIGGGGPEVIDGEDGADTINGAAGDDQVRGGAGKDDVEGGENNDVTDGGAGDDYVSATFHGGGCFTDTLIGGAGRDDLYVACGVPTLKMRDGAQDKARCLPKVTTATVDRDKTDAVTGGACERKSKGCKKKGKKRSAAAAKGKKKCRKKGRKRG